MRWLERRSHMILCAFGNVHTVLYCGEIQTNVRVTIDGIRERHGACTVYGIAWKTDTLLKADDGMGLLTAKS